jgi:hypothetical protein
MTNPLDQPSILILAYGVIPLWLAAGFADWCCHRASHIETTTGAKESFIHLLMFSEVGVPLLAGIFLEINAGTILLMFFVFLLHEATALWDVSYAITVRVVTPIEQHVHSFLEMMPLLAIACVLVAHWVQALALIDLGVEHPRFTLSLKAHQLPTSYTATLLGAIIVFEVLPYLEEFRRGLRANDGAWVPRRLGPNGTPGDVKGFDGGTGAN